MVTLLNGRCGPALKPLARQKSIAGQARADANARSAPRIFPAMAASSAMACACMCLPRSGMAIDASSISFVDMVSRMSRNAAACETTPRFDACRKAAGFLGKTSLLASRSSAFLSDPECRAHIPATRKAGRRLGRRAREDGRRERVGDRHRDPD